MTEHTVTLKAVLDQTELGDLNSVQSGVQTNFDKNISSVITKLNATLVNLQRAIDRLAQTAQRASAAPRMPGVYMPPTSRQPLLPLAPNLAAVPQLQMQQQQMQMYRQMQQQLLIQQQQMLIQQKQQQKQLQLQLQQQQTRQQLADPNSNLLKLVQNRFMQGLSVPMEEYTNGELVAKGPMISKQVASKLSNNTNVGRVVSGMALSAYDKFLREHNLNSNDLLAFRKPGASEYTTVKMDTIRRFANAVDRAAAVWNKEGPAPRPVDPAAKTAADIKAQRDFVKAMGLMFGANIFGGLAQTILPQNSGLRRGIGVAQDTLGGAMSGMMIGGPAGALAFGGAALGTSLFTDYVAQQQSRRLREQTANNSIREATKTFEDTMKSLDEFYKTLASARLDAQIQKDSAEWFKQATKSINETGALNPLLVSQRSDVQSNIAKQISNVEADLYKARNERYNRELAYNKDIAYLDESKAAYANIQDPTQKAELLARVEKQRTQLTQDYAKAMVTTNTQIDDFTDKLADLKEQLKQLSEYEKNLKDAQQKSIRTFVEGQQLTLLRESAEKTDKEVNLEAYRSGFHSMYRLASEYEQSRDAYDRELDEYLASDHSTETPQEVAEKTNRLIYDRQRAQQNLQEMMALNVRKRQELNQDLMGDYSNLTRMITSSQNAYSSRGFGFDEGNARNAAVIDIRNIARQIKENTDLLKQAGVYQ